MINGQTCTVMFGLLVASSGYAAPPPECPDITSPETAQAFMRCIEGKWQANISDESGIKQVTLDQDNTLVITQTMLFTEQISAELLQNEGLIVRRLACPDLDQAKLFNYGYSVRFDYLSTTGQPLDSILLNQTTCEKLK